MKHIITLSLLISSLVLYQYSRAQDVKTKVKEGPASSSTDNMNISGDHNMSGGNNLNSLTNTFWKTYIGEPVNDTIIIHYAIDSSSVHSKSTGETMIASIYKVSHDTLAFYDVSGTHACPSNMTGKYKLTVNGDTMKMDLIEDECDGRAAAIKNIIWRRMKENPFQ